MSLFDVLLDLLFPKGVCCPICGKPLWEEEGFCRECLAVVVLLWENLCPHCGRPLTAGDFPHCICRPEEDAFNLCRAAALYEGKLKEWIYRFKYGKEKEMASPFGMLLYEAAKGEKWMQSADLLVPVPLHPERLRWRGYNQAALLARELGKRANKPVGENLLCRVRQTSAQVGLSREERCRNLSGAFAAAEGNITGKRLVLIDDILTTGATANACAEALKKAGAKEVYVLVLARGI